MGHRELAAGKRSADLIRLEMNEKSSVSLARKAFFPELKAYARNTPRWNIPALEPPR
jgi:hypothetical protein